MARPGYVSLYADERTQKIFDEFIATKGITKSTALTDMMTIYMLAKDSELYNELLQKPEPLRGTCERHRIAGREGLP